MDHARTRQSDDTGVGVVGNWSKGEEVGRDGSRGGDDFVISWMIDRLIQWHTQTGDQGALAPPQEGAL